MRIATLSTVSTLFFGICVSAHPSLDRRIELDTLNASSKLITTGAPNGTLSEACDLEPEQYKQQLGISNTTHLTTDQESALTQLTASCYRLHTNFYLGGRDIPREILFKTLISAYDWAANEWHDSDQTGNRIFAPQNWYGMEISVKNQVVAELPQACIAWLLQAILIAMEGGNTFQEFNGLITNHGRRVVELEIRLALPPAGGSDLSIQNTNSSNNSPEPQSAGYGSAAELAFNASISLQERSESPKDASVGLSKRGSSPHTYNEKIRSQIRSIDRIGGAHQDLDLMGTLVAIAKRALTTHQANGYWERLPDKQTGLAVIPQWRRTQVIGSELLETLVDIVEWEYDSRQRTGTFWTCQVITETLDRGSTGWRAVSELQLSFEGSIGAALVQANVTYGAPATS